MGLFNRPHMSGTHLGEGEIHAWLDGALSATAAERVESHIAECGTCREAVAEARGFIAASSRILSALDAVPSGVIPAATRVRARGRMQRITAWPVSAIAAAIVVAVGVAVVARRVPTRGADRPPAAVPRAVPATPSVPPSAPSIAPAAAVPAPPSSRVATSHPPGPRAASAQAVPPMGEPSSAEERAVAMPAAPAPMPVPAPSVAAEATDAAVSAKAVPKGTVGGTGPVANMQSIRLMGISPVAAGARGSAGTPRLIVPGCDSAVRKAAADSSVSPSIPTDSTVTRDSVAQRDSVSGARRCP
jgi:anti-sigma factor RsiW